MKARLLHRHKDVLDERSMLELVVWAVPSPVPPSTHGFKYRLVFIRDGERIVGFDNERGKGDHMHLDGREFPYSFTSIEQLIEDFIAEVDRRRQT